MGFTYWAHGLHPPQPEEVPDGARRLTALQSMFVDLHSLLNSDDQGGPGPMDFLSAQAQVRRITQVVSMSFKLQQRVQAAAATRVRYL